MTDMNEYQFEGYAVLAEDLENLETAIQVVVNKGRRDDKVYEWLERGTEVCQWIATLPSESPERMWLDKPLANAKMSVDDLGAITGLAETLLRLDIPSADQTLHACAHDYH